MTGTREQKKVGKKEIKNKKKKYHTRANESRAVRADRQRDLTGDGHLLYGLALRRAIHERVVFFSPSSSDHA